MLDIGWVLVIMVTVIARSKLFGRAFDVHIVIIFESPLCHVFDHVNDNSIGSVVSVHFTGYFKKE